MTALWKLSARALRDALAEGEVTPGEALEAAEARIGAVNRHVNALPTLCFDRALARLAAAKGRPLAGLPVAIKDSVAVADVRTTYGSKVFTENVSRYSDAVVDRIEAAGGLVFAKSNTPEFEAGAHTFNEVFGTTRNPWNLSRSAGGSSGGAAAAVASGMAWIAQGTDFAASLRNPAGFCGVVGLRPSPGIVPQGPNALPFQTLSVTGPIARDVGDCALALDAMAGAHPSDPFAAAHESGLYEVAAMAPRAPARLAFSVDLGITPVDTEVRRLTRAAADRLAAEGVEVTEAHPELRIAHDAFGTLRAVQFASAWGHLLETYPALLKPDVVWNIEAGLAATGATITQAEAGRRAVRARMIAFLRDYNALLLPTAIVPPFPAEQRYVDECDGVRFDSYVTWMANCYAITLAGCPAISIPCGQTTDGLPIGLQIVTAPRTESALLSLAAWVEAVLGAGLATPIDPREEREDA